MTWMRDSAWLCCRQDILYSFSANVWTNPMERFEIWNDAERLQETQSIATVIFQLQFTSWRALVHKLQAACWQWPLSLRDIPRHWNVRERWGCIVTSATRYSLIGRTQKNREHAGTSWDVWVCPEYIYLNTGAFAAQTLTRFLWLEHYKACFLTRPYILRSWPSDFLVGTIQLTFDKQRVFAFWQIKSKMVSPIKYMRIYRDDPQCSLPTCPPLKCLTCIWEGWNSESYRAQILASSIQFPTKRQ